MIGDTAMRRFYTDNPHLLNHEDHEFTAGELREPTMAELTEILEPVDIRDDDFIEQLINNLND